MDIERTATLRRGLFHNVGDLNLDGTLTRTRAAASSAVSGSLSLQLSGDELVNYRQLFNSARNGDVQKVKELLTGALGLSVNFGGPRGATPLHIAARFGQAAMVDLLVSHGADPSARDDRGQTPLDKARAFGLEEVVQRLQSAPTASRPFDPRCRRLLEAAHRGDAARIGELVAAHPELLDARGTARPQLRPPARRLRRPAPHAPHPRLAPSQVRAARRRSTWPPGTAAPTPWPSSSASARAPIRSTPPARRRWTRRGSSTTPTSSRSSPAPPQEADAEASAAAAEAEEAEAGGLAAAAAPAAAARPTAPPPAAAADVAENADAAEVALLDFGDGGVASVPALRGAAPLQHGAYWLMGVGGAASGKCVEVKPARTRRRRR